MTFSQLCPKQTSQINPFIWEYEVKQNVFRQQESRTELNLNSFHTLSFVKNKDHLHKWQICPRFENSFTLLGLDKSFWKLNLMLGLFAFTAYFDFFCQTLLFFKEPQIDKKKIVFISDICLYKLQSRLWNPSAAHFLCLSCFTALRQRD